MSPILNPETPLGLPKGSVRGLIAIFFAGTVCIQALTGVPIDPLIAGLAGAVVQHYFVSRGKEDEAAEEPLPEPEL